MNEKTYCTNEGLYVQWKKRGSYFEQIEQDVVGFRVSLY